MHFQRACRLACTNLLGYLVRCVRTRGMVEIAESAKPPIFTLSFAAHTCHAWLARLPRARGRSFLRGRKALLNDFWYFSSLKSTRKDQLLYDSLRRQQALPCLGDAVQRWLRHPEPSSSSQKSTIKCKCNKHKHTLFRKNNTTKG